MNSELGVLALSGLVLMVIILINVVTALAQVGFSALAGPRDDMPKLTGIAGRWERATANAVVAMALFAPAVLILQATNGFTENTLLICQVFLAVRIAHPILYALSIPLLRTLVWICGFMATGWLYLLAL